jgi:hypothetical protein
MMLICAKDFVDGKTDASMFDSMDSARRKTAVF